VDPDNIIVQRPESDISVALEANPVHKASSAVLSWRSIIAADRETYATFWRRVSPAASGFHKMKFASRLRQRKTGFH
jgi:hypothetical protein